MWYTNCALDSQAFGDFNAVAQGFADRTSAWTNSQREARADKAKGQVWNATGITGALQGDKIGNLGVNLDNVAMLKEREEERKAKAEEKRAERVEVKAELEAEVKVESKTEQETEIKTESEPKVEQEEQFAEKSSNETESERDPEQERYEAYWRAKEGPDGDLPPDMTREDYERYQLASSKVALRANEGIGTHQADVSSENVGALATVDTDISKNEDGKLSLKDSEPLDKTNSEQLDSEKKSTPPRGRRFKQNIPALARKYTVSGGMFGVKNRKSDDTRAVFCSDPQKEKDEFSKIATEGSVETESIPTGTVKTMADITKITTRSTSDSGGPAVTINIKKSEDNVNGYVTSEDGVSIAFHKIHFELEENA